MRYMDGWMDGVARRDAGFGVVLAVGFFALRLREVRTVVELARESGYLSCVGLAG